MSDADIEEDFLRLETEIWRALVDGDGLNVFSQDTPTSDTGSTSG